MARPGAGALILGHSLRGATRFYLSPPEILQAAAQNLAIPDEWSQSSAGTRQKLLF
jgi:hypothetical protein